MGELEPVPDRPQEDASHECVAGIARFLKQRSEMGQTEALAEDGRGLDGAPILHRQKIGAGEHDILNRVRKPPVGEVPRASQQLLEEQGIAARPLDALGRETLGVDETPGDRERVDRRERREIDRDQACAAGRAAPVSVQRIAIETGRHRQHAAARGRGAGNRGKEAERLGVGPMDVLDRDEQRLMFRRSFYQLRDDALLALRPGCRIHRFIESARRFRLRDLEQISQIEGIVGLQPQLTSRRIDRAFDGVERRAGFDADQPGHHRPDGAVAALGPEIEKKARVRRHARRQGRRLQLVHQPRLADPCFAADEDSGPGCSLDAGVQDSAEHSHLGAAADERMGVRGRNVRSGRAPDVDWTIEPLQPQRANGLIGDRVAGRPIDGIRDERFPAGRAREKPCGDISGLTGDGIAAMAIAADRACDDFADGDADVRRKRSRHARLQIRKGGMNLQGGAHRAFGVIAVGDRRAEQRHRRVADVLVDRSAEAVDDRVDQREEALQQCVHFFRIELRREARITNQIAKQNRDRTTVALGNGAATRFGRRDAIVGEEPPAAAAVPGAAFVGVTAFPTRRGQGGAAGRAEFAFLAVLELAVLTTQFC